YDALNRQTTTIEAYNDSTGLQRTSTTQYDANNNVTAVTVPHAYDSQTGTFPADSPARVTTSYLYDELDRRIKTIEAVGVPGQQRTTKDVFDAADNLVEEDSPIGYDLNSQGQANSNPAFVVSSFAYDRLNEQ